MCNDLDVGKPLTLQRGVVLLEGLIAVLIFSFGILLIVGLQANSMRMASQAKMRIDASFIANQRLATIWAERNSLSSYVETNTPMTELPSGTRSTAVNGNQVTVTVTWKVPGDSSDYSFVTTSNIVFNPIT